MLVVVGKWNDGTPVGADSLSYSTGGGSLSHVFRSE